MEHWWPSVTRSEPLHKPLFPSSVPPSGDARGPTKLLLCEIAAPAASCLPQYVVSPHLYVQMFPVSQRGSLTRKKKRRIYLTYIKIFLVKN